MGFGSIEGMQIKIDHKMSPLYTCTWKVQTIDYDKRNPFPVNNSVSVGRLFVNDKEPNNS